MILSIECLCNYTNGRLISQSMVDRWNSDSQFAQVTAFLSDEASVTSDSIAGTNIALRQALKNAGQEQETGRILADAYCTWTTLNFSSNKAGTSFRTYGVGGDFFLFHPLTLVSGSYFDDETDENSDGVVLDERAAWALFGGTDVEGMIVEAANTAYVVRGVVKAEAGPFAKAAGAEEPTIYMNFKSLEKAVSSDNKLYVRCYEILMRDAVDGFSRSMLETSLGIKEERREIIENSRRFSFSSRVGLVKNFYVRAMNTKSVVYPVWENRARCYEQFCIPLTILELILITILVINIIILVYALYSFIKTKIPPKDEILDKLNKLF